MIIVVAIIGWLFCFQFIGVVGVSVCAICALCVDLKSIFIPFAADFRSFLQSIAFSKLKRILNDD